MVFKKSTFAAPALIIAALMFAPTGASAQLLYCCQDAKHVRHCSDSLPQQCIGRAHTVRGKGGKLVREVSAPLTPEQQKVKDELEKRKQQDDIARKEQALKDKALLATYSSEAEIDKARLRSEKDVEEGLKQTQLKVDAAEKKKSALTDENIIKERIAPEDRKQKLREIDHEVATQRGLLEGKKKDLETVRLKFAEDKRRYLEIKNRSGARTP